jgi:methylglyoxal synthase
MNNTLKKTQKRIVIVADNNKKTDLIQWSYQHRPVLQPHYIIATGPSADLLQGTLNTPVTKLPCISLGGYHELSQMIEEKSVDIIFFFGELREEHAYDTGIEALLPAASEQEIVVACNQATADVIVSALAEDNRNPFTTKRYLLEPRENNALVSISSTMA